MKKLLLSAIFLLGLGFCAVAQDGGEATKRCQNDYGSNYYGVPASNTDYHGVIRHEESSSTNTRSQSIEGSASGKFGIGPVKANVQGTYDSGHDNRSSESRNSGDSYYKCEKKEDNSSNSSGYRRSY